MFPKNQFNQELAERIFLEELEECEKFPKYFEIETINVCNAQCIMCPISKSNTGNKRKIMTMELFQKFLDEISEYNDWIETVCLNRDGEPTLDKTIHEKVRMLKDIKIKKVTLTTNAQLLDENLVCKLIESNLDDIMISIDSINKETYESIRKGLNFETVLENILKLIEIRNKRNSKMTIRIRMVIMDKNKDEVDAWKDFWNKKLSHIDRAYAMPEHSWGNQLKEENLNKRERYKQIPCVFPFSSMAIHSDGIVSLCNVDYNRKHTLGNLNCQTIKEIWISEVFKEVRKLHANAMRNDIELCKGCDLWNRDYV